MSVPSLYCREIEEVLGAYALEALEPEEDAAVAAHLAVCPRCQAQAAQAAAVADALAILPPPVVPPPELKARLLASVAASYPSAAMAPPEPIPLRPRRRLSAATAALAALAAALLIAAGVLGVALNRVSDERDDARSSAQMISDYVSSGGQVVPLTTQDVELYDEYHARGTLLVAPGKDPLVVVTGCPKSNEHLTYRVWFSREGQRSPMGELWVDADGSGMLRLSPSAPLSEYDTIGVTALLPENERQDLMVGDLPPGTLN